MDAEIVPEQQIRKNKGHENLRPSKKGEVRNPNGRPVGSRNKFSEAFLLDILNDWKAGGKEAIQRVREEDPSTYLRVAASLVPKEFTINEGESSLERLLVQYSDGQLDQLIAGLCALGASGAAGTGKVEEVAAIESAELH